MRAGPDSRRSLLSWDSLLGPLHRHARRASTPGSRSSLWPDAATRQVPFRPRGFSPPRRFPPRGGCGSVAPRCRSWSSPRFALVITSARRRPEAVTERGKTTNGPRDAVHTLRRLPLVNSRCASRRPLPSCRYHPARYGAGAEAAALSGAPVARGRLGESRRGTPKSALHETRDEELDSVMLRSAEADPHVTEHEAPAPPKRCQMARTGPLVRARRRSAGWGKRPDHLRGWLPLRSAPTLARRPKTPPEALHDRGREAARAACVALAEASGTRARRILRRVADFKALLR
jgi:hypothetical protein